MMTQQEVADMLQVSIRTVWLWRKQGLPSIKINRSVRFEKEAVLDWMRQQQQAKEA